MEQTKANSSINENPNSNNEYSIDGKIMLKAISQELTEAQAKIVNYRAMYLQAVQTINKQQQIIKELKDSNNSKNK